MNEIKGAFYSKWHSAQRALRNALHLNSDQGFILDEWMRKHIFELDVTHSVANELFEKRVQIDIKKEVRYMNMRRLAEMIYEKGLYSEEYSEDFFRDYFYSNFTHRILVIRVPDFCDDLLKGKMPKDGIHPKR